MGDPVPHFAITDTNPALGKSELAEYEILGEETVTPFHMLGLCPSEQPEEE